MSTSTPKNDPVEASLDDRKPDTVGTPEGDNEFPPDAPLTPASEGLQAPSGDAHSPHKEDTHKPTGVEKFIDEVARGEYM